MSNDDKNDTLTLLSWISKHIKEHKPTSIRLTQKVLDIRKI